MEKKAQQLRVLAAFAEDLGLIRSTYTAAHHYDPSSRESTGTHVVHIYACMLQTHMEYI